MDQSLRRRMITFYERADNFFIGMMARHGVTILRVALAIVFLWFGALKVFGVSPVVALVAATVYWANPDWFVPLLGVWEMAIGLGLLFRFALRVTLFLLYVQLAGTFLLPIIQPEVAFIDGNPLLLTTEGEFVVKNLVLLAAGIVIGGTLERREAARGAEHLGNK